MGFKEIFLNFNRPREGLDGRLFTSCTKTRQAELVEGTWDIRIERETELYISDTAEVGRVTGEMSIDDAVRFSGKKP